MIKRRQVRIKDFLILAWWDTNAQLTWEKKIFGAEVHYERTGKYKIVYANTKRELVKQVRLQCAIFKNPQIANVIDRFDAKMNTKDFTKMLNDYIPASLLQAELVKTDYLLAKLEKGDADV